MPEPDINDPDFDHPTTEPVRGSGFGRPVNRRLRARKKLPLEFAAFRLNDGRALGQVVGPDLFGPLSGSDGGAALPRGVRDRLAENKSPLAGIMRADSRIASRPKPADEGGILDPLSGPDEREPAGAAVNSSVAGRLPAGIAGGMPGPDRGAPDVDPRVIAGMDDAGLTGLADSRLDFDELTALKPKTYGDSMRYAAAIAKVAGMRKEEVDGLGSLLTRDENGMPRDVSGADILPSRARENYERFVAAARARRNIPIDIPLTADGKIDYSLVQPGFLYKGGRGVVLNVGPDRKSFVEAPRRPEKVEAAPTKPENGARPAAAKVDPRSIADMDGPWPDVDPRSIAGMDDAGLDVPATRIGKARDTVAALEGVTLPSAVDQVRRDTLKAMVGIHAGGKLPRDYARKARNKTMLDFMAASPALRESMLADQIGLLMDGISDNGKRAVGAYTALKGKMKGIEAMNLPRLYDLKRELEGDVNMGERQRRNFAILVDNEIGNSTFRGDTPRAEDAREAARKSKWGPVRLDGERPVDGDAMARLMEDYPGLFDGGGPSGELNGWLLSRDGMVSRVQEAEARLKEVEAKEAVARAAGEHVSDSPLYGSAGAKRALANAKGVLEEQDARILKRARELGLIHENREGVAWLPGAATPGVDSEPEGVSAIPFDAEGNVDTGRLRVNRYYRRKDDGSVWYWTGKEMVDTRQKLETSDIVVENGEVARDLLVKGEIYEVEDGTRFVWDGANFQEVYQNRKSGTWLPLTKAKPLRLFDDNLNIRPADEIEDEARALAQMAGVNVLLVMQIRGDASMLGHAEREIAKAKADAKIYNIPESDYPLLLKWKAKYEEVVNRLVDNQQELMRESEAALDGRIEALSAEKMMDRKSVSWWSNPEYVIDLRVAQRAFDQKHSKEKVRSQGTEAAFKDLAEDWNFSKYKSVSEDIGSKESDIASLQNKIDTTKQTNINLQSDPRHGEIDSYPEIPQSQKEQMLHFNKLEIVAWERELAQYKDDLRSLEKQQEDFAGKIADYESAIRRAPVPPAALAAEKAVENGELAKLAMILDEFPIEVLEHFAIRKCVPGGIRLLIFFSVEVPAGFAGALLGTVIGGIAGTFVAGPSGTLPGMGAGANIGRQVGQKWAQDIVLGNFRYGQNVRNLLEKNLGEEMKNQEAIKKFIAENHEQIMAAGSLDAAQQLEDTQLDIIERKKLLYPK